MPTPYRASALSVARQRRVAFGTAEHSVVRIGVAPEEAVARLSAITGPPPPRGGRKARSDMPFLGTVGSTELSLVPSGWLGAFIQVKGQIRAEGGGTVVLLRVALPLPMVLLGAVFTSVVVAVVVALPLQASLYLVELLGVAAFFVGGSVVAARRGIASTSRAILRALDPELAPGDSSPAADLDPEALLDFDTWMKQLDDWESKHTK